MTDPADKDAEIDFRAVGFTAEAAQFQRPPLAVAMLAAFNNVSVDQLHAGQRYFPNEHMMRAWERVADTARLTIIAEFEAEIERTIKINADLDAEIAALKAEVARLTREHNAMLTGLSAIIHCQSHLSRREMRDAAASILDEAGLKPKWIGGDQSPFVLRAESAEARVKELEAGLLSLLRHVDNETCTHEDTYRGGLIWTICSACGCKWADDRGGFVPHCDAPAVSSARALLSPKDKTNETV